MADSKGEAEKIAARCRRIGWKVVRGNGRQDFLYRITPVPLPEGCTPVQIHSSPSDVNWVHSVMRGLNAAGFEQAEKAYLAQKDAEKAARLEDDRRRNEEATKKAAAQSAMLTKAAGKHAGPQPVDRMWLLTPTQWPETKTVIMTPDDAAAILDAINTHNRPLREAHWRYLMQIILDDEWSCTHQGGAVDSNGVLQDGQHRLKAIAESGRAVAMQWSVGMDPDNFAKVDTGKNRSARDTLFIAKEADPTTMAATAKMLIVIDLYGPDAHVKYKSYKVTNEKVARTREALGDPLRVSVAKARSLKKELKKTNPSALAAAHFLISQRLPANDKRVAKFFYDLEYGLGLNDRTDPVWLLRRLLLDSRYTAWVTLAYLMKAWNLRASGRRMQQLVWRPGNESFPYSVFLPPPLEPDEEAQLALALGERELVAA